MASNVSGGTKLLAALGAIADRAGAAYVRVGFMDGAQSPDGILEAQIAFWNEFGKDADGDRPAQPPRPFFRRMIAEVTPQVSAKMEGALAFTNMNSAAALALVGEWLNDELVASIQKLRDPKLAPSTIAAKGSDKPLIHHGDMQRSSTYEVVQGDAEEKG